MLFEITQTRLDNIEHLRKIITEGAILKVEAFFEVYPQYIEQLKQNKAPVLHYVFDTITDDMDTASRLDMLKLLIECGISIDTQNEQGETALHLAVEESPEIVKYLLEQRATCNIQDMDGQTALHIAAYLGRDTSFELLLQADRDCLFLQDNNHMTPLALASMQIAEVLDYNKTQDVEQWQHILNAIYLCHKAMKRPS